MAEQFAYPPRLVSLPDGGVTLATVSQDSDDEIRSAVSLLIDVRPGQLAWAPEVGTPSPLGFQSAALAEEAIETALREHEHRATVQVTASADLRRLKLRLEGL